MSKGDAAGHGAPAEGARPGARRLAAPASEALLGECTQDAILRGRLRLWQPRQGYRFSVDALLVAHFGWQGLCLPSPSGAGARGKPRRVADLGAGSGVVGLSLAERCTDVGVDLVEIQERLAALAATNAAVGDLSDRVIVYRADLGNLRGLLPGDRYALVVSNPPFAPTDTGRESPDAERATATAERRMSLTGLVASAARLLAPRGAFSVIYPAERLPDLVVACAASGLHPTRARGVHPGPAQDARRVLLEARKASASPLRWMPPLVLHEAPGRYSVEAEAILEGAWEEAPGGQG